MWMKAPKTYPSPDSPCLFKIGCKYFTGEMDKESKIVYLYNPNGGKVKFGHVNETDGFVIINTKCK